jgi:hypothetical protein
MNQFSRCTTHTKRPLVVVTTEVEVGLKSQVTSEENLLVVASSISNGSAVSGEWVSAL